MNKFQAICFVFAAAILFGLTMTLQAYSQVAPVPDDSITVESSASGDRVSKIMRAAVKSVLRAELRKERLKVFRRDQAKIEALELALESDELLDYQLQKLTSKYKAEKSEQIRTLADGDLFRDIIEWLGSDEFKEFMATILEIVKTIIDLVGGISWTLNPFNHVTPGLTNA